MSRIPPRPPLVQLTPISPDSYTTTIAPPLLDALERHRRALRAYQTSPISTLPKSPISNPQGTAVMVEPRKHRLLEVTIRNIYQYIGHRWNIIVYTHYPEQIREIVPDIPVEVRYIETENLNGKTQSQIFMNRRFWEGLPTENILIFQTDSLIINPDVDIGEFLVYPYIGGNYFLALKPGSSETKIVCYYQKENGSKPEYINISGSCNKTYGINGGFSLRRRSWMIRCCGVSIREINQNNYLHVRDVGDLDSEDVFFQNAIDYLEGNLPKLHKCYEFCLQTMPFNELKNPIKSFGVHAYNRGAFIGFVEKFNELIDIINKNTEKIMELGKTPQPRPQITSQRNSRGNSGTKEGTILRLD